VYCVIYLCIYKRIYTITYSFLCVCVVLGKLEMDDVGSLLAEAASEIHVHPSDRARGAGAGGGGGAGGGASAEKFFGDMEVERKDTSSENDRPSGNRNSSSSSSNSKRPLSSLDALRQAANTAANEERDDSAHAFKSADIKVSKSIEEDYDQTFDDDNVDGSEVGGILGNISEDIHNNKIEYDANDIDKVLMEAAEDLDKPERPVSSPDVSDDEDPGEEDRNRELIIATATGNEKSARWLLSHGASYKARDAHGWTPLMWAASKGNDDIMGLLLDAAGEDRLRQYVNKQDALSGWTALHVAAVGGHISCIKILIASKAKNYRKNKFGEIAADGISFAKSSPEYGACMRALGHEYKYANNRGSDDNRRHAGSGSQRSSRK
jgi:ankyrin repeat protein